MDLICNVRHFPLPLAPLPAGLKERAPMRGDLRSLRRIELPGLSLGDSPISQLPRLKTGAEGLTS
jgi:hypothetical protein